MSGAKGLSAAGSAEASRRHAKRTAARVNPILDAIGGEGGCTTKDVKPTLADYSDESQAIHRLPECMEEQGGQDAG